jgi:hypothetical protein
MLAQNDSTWQFSVFVVPHRHRMTMSINCRLETPHQAAGSRTTNNNLYFLKFVQENKKQYENKEKYLNFPMFIHPTLSSTSKHAFK